MVTAAGDVDAADTDDHAMYRVRAGGDTLQIVVPPNPTHFTGPNGLALFGDGRRLSAASLQGIGAVDIATRVAAYS